MNTANCKLWKTNGLSLEGIVKLTAEALLLVMAWVFASGSYLIPSMRVKMASQDPSHHHPAKLWAGKQSLL